MNRLFKNTFEPEYKPQPGTGQAVSAACDECGAHTNKPRKRAKVKAGPLKGLQGNICWRCMEKRQEVAA